MVRIYGFSDDLVEIEGAGRWDDEYGCYNRDAIIYFDDGTVLRMTYDDGRWKAVVENKGTANYRITKLVDGDDYYSDLFEIDDTCIFNVRMEDVQDG